MSEQIDLQKAESVQPTRKIPKRESGQPRVVTSNQYIETKRRKELNGDTKFKTFDLMLEDTIVSTPIKETNNVARRCLTNGKFKPKSSEKSKLAANYLNYCIRNMSYGTWLETVNNMLSDIEYGYSLQNIVLEKRKYGKYKGSYCIKKLAPRSQKSIAAWVFNKSFTEVIGVLQKPNLYALNTPNRKPKQLYINDPKSYETEYTFIPIEALVHCRFNPKNNVPVGNSPLEDIYNPWQESKIIENLEIQGMQKDLVGIAIVRDHEETIKAAGDPDDAQHEVAVEAKEELQVDVTNLISGTAGFIYLSGEADPTTKKYYQDLELKGIDGGGKQYITSEVIKEKRTAIYNHFGCGHLLLGQSGNSGSEALSSNKMTTHEQYVEDILMWKKEVIDNQIAKTLLRENGVELDYEDMPEFEPAPIAEADIEGLSKSLQRLKSTNCATHEMIKWHYDRYGVNHEGVEDIDLTDKGTSRAGENTDGTSGNGNSNQENSDTNLDNKSFYKDDEDEDYIYVRVEGHPDLIKVAKND